MQTDRLDGLFDETHRNATVGWIIVVVLCILAAIHAFESSFRWFVFTGLAVAIVLLPAASHRDPRVMPPWELLVLVAVPVVDATILGEAFLTSIAVYIAVAAVALVAVTEIHRFTAVRMTHSFAIALVVITTLAVAATWNVAQWTSALAFGTPSIDAGRSADAANHAMMMDFVYATIAGFLAGIVFNRYAMRSTPSDGGFPPSRSVDSVDDHSPSESAPQNAPDSPSESDTAPPFLRSRLDASDQTIRRLSRLLQLALGFLFLYGLLTLDATTITNAGIALAITGLPALLERDLRLPLEPELVLWITGAVFLHALGSAGLYGFLGPWDSLTHAVSASIVAGTGYTVVRAIDLYTDDIYLPPRMLFVFILLFVLAFGVIWELMEFALGFFADWFGSEVVLAQHGITDTIGDLFYDLVGAIVVAIWGSVYLTDVSHRLVSRFDE
ncbi:hypothetical protein [Natrialba aegyptia]|uniref:Uncharacterized protein n=1 Tax=Natrialba aegyptia DSM 13077 TaxID=1227491 RepID=M0BAW4_9EURY|nr:hypothetical protein [Natrialba aegyptia]ELZ06809.1 hypothetical protein C480_07257 [Natrialba aegyptia DSM 13077]